MGPFRILYIARRLCLGYILIPGWKFHVQAEEHQHCTVVTSLGAEQSKSLNFSFSVYFKLRKVILELNIEHCSFWFFNRPV